MKRIIYIAIFCLALLNSSMLRAQSNAKPGASKWLPSSFQTQFAGNIGMVSAGLNWSVFNDRLAINPSFGYVPQFGLGDDILISTLKFSYVSPYSLDKSNFSLKPLTFGFALSRVHGERFNKYQDPELYPKRYYWWNTANRIGLTYKPELLYHTGSDKIKDIGLYLEGSIWDLGLFSLMQNSNQNYLAFHDILVLGLGVVLHW